MNCVFISFKIFWFKLWKLYLFCKLQLIFRIRCSMLICGAIWFAFPEWFKIIIHLLLKVMIRIKMFSLFLLKLNNDSWWRVLSQNDHSLLSNAFLKETSSATICWSPKAVALPCFGKCRWGGCNGHANRECPRRQFKFSNSFACPLNPLPTLPRS